MLFMSKFKHKKALLIGLGIVLLVGIAFIFARSNSPTFSSTDPEVLRQELDRVTQYELENGCVEKNDRGQQVFCGESKTKVDAANAAYEAAVKSDQTPSQTAMVQDQVAIASFMGNDGYQVTFMGAQHPANFTVGVVTPISNGGDTVTHGSTEWERMVNVYQSKDTIADTCEVYRFEVYPKTHEVVEVGVVYPNGANNCGGTGDLTAPKITDAQVKTTGEGYLERALGADYAAMKSKFSVTPTGKDGGSDRIVWMYQDTSFKLPAGLTAEPKYPTLRLYVANSGVLLQYNNSLPLFKQ